jgi:hypothetical protein
MPLGFGLLLLQLAGRPCRASDRRRPAVRHRGPLMDPLTLGALVAVATILVLFSGVSVARGC